MAPNVSAPTGVLLETDEEVMLADVPNEKVASEKYQLRLVWRNIAVFVYLHAIALYGIYLMLTSAKILTSLWGKFNCEHLKF